MLKGVFAKEPVNTGRQLEFDYLKGLFLFAILFFHAFQVAGSGLGTNAAAYKIIYIICTMSGASIFIFVMGLGSRYSRASIGDMVRSGGRLFGYQYLNNIAWFAAAFLPVLILQFFTDTTEAWGMVSGYSELYLFYINIFFIAGGIYLILALMRRLKTPVWIYVALGLVINAVSPKLIGLSTGFPLIDYVLGGIFGGTPTASFSILNYLPYALLGVGFGEALKRAANKNRFYGIACSLSLVAIAGFCLWLSQTYHSFDELYEYIRITYIRPDFIRTIANTATVILLAGLLHFANRGIMKCAPVYKQLNYYSKHISKYYAIHPPFYLFVWGFHLYKPFGFVGCFILFISCIAFTEIIVRLYNSYLHKKVNPELSI